MAEEEVVVVVEGMVVIEVVMVEEIETEIEDMVVGIEIGVDIDRYSRSFFLTNM